MMMYKLLVTTIYVIVTVYFHYLMVLLMVTVIYGYSFSIVYLSLLSITFDKMAKKNIMMSKPKKNIMRKTSPPKGIKERLLMSYRKMANVLMRKPSPPKGIKVRTLIPCNYLDTFVLDGRSKCLDTFVLDGGDGKSRTMNTINIDSEKLKKKYKKMVNICSYILHISVWLYNVYALLLISTKSFLIPATYIVFMITDTLITYTWSNNFKGNKLLLFLLCYLVNVSNITTPKGRPKKKGFKGFKPKKLDFTPVCSNVNLNNKFNVNPDINRKVLLYQRDITKIQVHAIVNAAKESLLGGGGIDKIIHQSAGPQLKIECQKIPEKRPGVRCDIGECKVTKSYGDLMNYTDYVFHTVGPRNQNHDALRNCYESCLHNVTSNKIKSIAFCCIGTGIFKFDQYEAANIALNTVRVWLESNHESIERVIFCTYTNKDYDIYKNLMSTYFPDTPDCFSGTKGDEMKPCSSNVKETPCTPEKANEINDDIDFDTDRTNDNVPSIDLTSMPFSDRLDCLETSSTQRWIVRTPAKLKNTNNVCFFNSVAQVFYSIPSFRMHILNSTVNNIVVSNLRNLFDRMNTSSTDTIIKTSNYVETFDIPDYTPNQQHDVLVLIRHILDHTNVIDNIFKMTYSKSIVCNNCNRRSFTTCNMPIFTLDIDDPYSQQTVSGLLRRVLDSHGCRLPQYQCKIVRNQSGNEVLDENGNRQGCDQFGCCDESIQITEVGDIMILQFKVYTEDLSGRRSKIFPNMIIDQEIIQYDYFDLQGIIWHHGRDWQNGHYTSDVKIDGIWYSTSDTYINERPTFECNSNGDIAPYIIVYKKRNTQIVPYTNKATTSSSSTSNEISEVLDRGCFKRKNDEINETNSKKSRKDNFDNTKNNSEMDRENVLIDTEETFIDIDHQPEETVEDEYVENNASKKFNFSKRKAQPRNIKRLKSRIAMREKRATAEGRKKYNEYQKKYV